MRNQMLYKELAKYYDLIYSWKDYGRETNLIKKLILKYKKYNGNELLDVACGTGLHLKYFKNNFSCTGIDISKEMLKVAKKKVKGVIFKQANMINFSLNKKFDVILCLFSSIGYVKTYSNFKRTIKNFAKHLKKGGVVITEGWIPKSLFNAGFLKTDIYEGKRISIVRMHISKIKKNISVLNTHYLIGEKDKSIRYFSDKHELGFFDVNKTLNIMKELGLHAKFLKKGMMKDRGIYVGVKN